jgi:hypothetical protein
MLKLGEVLAQRKNEREANKRKESRDSASSPHHPTAEQQRLKTEPKANELQIGTQ